MRKWITGLGLLLMAMVFLALPMIPGCASDSETGERVSLKQAAPSPPEARLIAYGVMRLAIAETKMDADKLGTIRSIMKDSQTVLLTGLKDDPTNLDMIRMNYLKDKNPEMGMLANTVLQVLVLRLRPLIDQGKTDKAAEYIEAVLDGAVAAIDAKTETAWRQGEWDIQYVARSGMAKPVLTGYRPSADHPAMTGCPGCHLQRPQAGSLLLRT